MFQILKDPRYDFMRFGPVLLGLSAILVLAAVGVLLVRGLNLGIEFTGGTELQLKYAAAPDIAEIRNTLGRAGIDAQVTTIGTPEEHEVYVRLTGGGRGDDEDLTGLVARTLRGAGQAGRIDLNIADQATVETVLREAPGFDDATADELAAAILERRKEVAAFASLDDLQALPGLSEEAREYLGGRAFLGPFAVRSQSYIGPAVGKELMRKAQLAIVLSLISMLVYIWIRFQLQWGFAAVLALVHDTLITLGLFSLFDKEMTLPVVAAFLTLVGYSVNDTVVIFDRVRENLRNRVGGDFQTTVNLAVNQTLSRTIITSGLTWLVVFGLYLFAGPALNAFAFVLTVGVIAGSYSTIYIASPFLVLWSRFVGRRVGEAAPAADATVQRTKKVRSS